MKSEELDRKFDEGVDLSDHIDWSSARRPNLEPYRLEMDLPVWMVRSLDRRAMAIGVDRSALIRLWLADRLQQASHPPLAAE